MKPAISILNPAFKYRSAVHTNIAATFDRVRREQAAAAKAPSVHQADRDGNVKVLAIMAQRREGK